MMARGQINQVFILIVAVVVIVAMLVGARLVGLIGIILAVPVIASIGLVLKDFMGQVNKPWSASPTDINKRE